MSMDSSYFTNTSVQNQTSSSQQNVSQSNLFTSISYMDELVKEYLLFRGFNSTLKSYEHDLKQDKDKSFKADKVTDMLLSFVHSYDLNGLLEFWSYLDFKYFSRITLKLSNITALTRKYELFLLRYYLIYALQTYKTDKAFELFENYASKLQSQVEWRDWYCLPFLKNPEENQIFSVYFSKNWIDTFIVSLQNFLNIVFQSVQFPRLLNYEEDAFWNKQPALKNQPSSANSFYTFEQEYLQNEVIDEFQLLDTDLQNRQGNTFINMIRNFANGSKYKPQTSKSSTSTTSTNSGSSNDLVNSINTRIPSTRNSLFDYGNKNKPLTPTTTKIHKSSSEYIQKDSISNSTQLTDYTKQDNSTGSTISNLVNRNINLPLMSNANESNSNEEKSIEKQDDFQSSHINEFGSDLKIDPYLTLSQDDYKEHKSAILHCKFSPDGKYIASVDVDGLIKIWSIGNSLTTLSTLMQKGSVLTIEWDKRNTNILYIGTKSNLVKIYDLTQKKIIQELVLNKSHPIVISIYSVLATPKVFVLSASKTPIIKEDSIRNGQMLICSSNLKNFNLSIEKQVDFDNSSGQSMISYRSNYILIGCSDGIVRIFDFVKHTFNSSEKCHSVSITNMRMNKTETLLLTVSHDSIRAWTLSIDLKLNLLKEIHLTNRIQIPFYNFDHFAANNNELSDLKVPTSSNLVSFDSSENYLFLLDKNQGACLENFQSNQIEKCNFNFSLENSTTLELWNASHLCILLIGSSNGTLRIFKLLHQY